MKASEFYEKYYKIDLGNGNIVSAPPLSDKEKEFLDNAADNPNVDTVHFIRARRRSGEINLVSLKTAMGKYESK